MDAQFRLPEEAPPARPGREEHTLPSELRSFQEVFQQVQVLQHQLWDVHEATILSLGGESVGFAPSPSKSGRPSHLTTTPFDVSNDSRIWRPIDGDKTIQAHPGPSSSLHDEKLCLPGSLQSDMERRLADVKHNESFASAVLSDALAFSPRSKMSTKLVKQARQVSERIEDQIDGDSVGALQLRAEWDLSDEKLQELKKLQRRMSATSLASSTATKKSKKRQYLVKSVVERQPWCIVHPTSRIRVLWDCTAILAILLEMSVSPLHLYRLDETAANIADGVQGFLTLFWALDMGASFCTATYINDTLTFRLVDIAKKYLWSWFWFDLFMLIPDILGMFLELDDGPAGILRVARSRRVLRLFRFFQIIKTWKLVERFESARLQLRNDIGPLTLPLFYVTSVLLLAVHVLGSLWFAVGDTEEGWVQEEELHTMPLSRQYTRSLEWALSKLPPSSLRLTVDLKTPGERWLGILGTCLALVCGSLFVSFVTNTMAGVARTSIRTKQVLRSVQKYCGLYGIPYAYSMQIRRYVEREHRRKELANHMNLLNDLPDGMVRELFQEARSQTLHHHAFFREVGLSNNSMEVDLCSQAVSELYVLASDVIFETNMKTQGMYLNADGIIIYFYNLSLPEKKQQPQPKAEKPKARTKTNSMTGIFPGFLAKPRNDFSMAQTMIEIGEYVAEPALWVKSWRYQGQLQAVVESRMLLVIPEELFSVLRHYTEAMSSAIVYARCFLKELNSVSMSTQVTDLPLVPSSPDGSKSFHFLN